jgi:hypothetical protein
MMDNEQLNKSTSLQAILAVGKWVMSERKMFSAALMAVALDLWQQQEYFG